MNLISRGTKGRREARLWSTVVLLLGLFVTRISLPSDSSVAIFSHAAYGVGLTLLIAILIEASSGVRALIRVDFLVFLSLFGLTLLEFLFRQPDVEGMVGPAAASDGTNAVLVAYGGLAIGRHFVPIKQNSLQGTAIVADLPASSVFMVFIVVTVFGYLHIFLAVNFDIFEAIQQMLWPRFSQSWSRGQYGDAAALLFELGALINLIPPVAGLIFARAQHYSMSQKAVVVAVLIFTAYYGFASGTRSIFVTYIMTFTGMYIIAKPQLRLRHAITISAIMLAFLFAGITLMLQFRTVGLGILSSTDASASFYVDLDIVNIAHLTEKFPQVYDYLGLEVPFNALVRPIPRILWPGKPTGLSVPIEVALDSGEGLTVSCTYIGEAYMAGGLLAVLIISLSFGAATEMWNRVGLTTNQQFSQIVYVSGFLCAALAARSMLGMMPLMLPTLAIWILGRLWLRTPHVPTSKSATDRGGT
jgi:oligosaccharide repeat unit polymerase